MKNSIATVKSNQKIAEQTFEMVLQMAAADREDMKMIRPGQFIDIKVDGYYLRRPISICDWDYEAGTITIIYKAVGAGTEAMSNMSNGKQMDILWPLGNGYDLEGIAPTENPEAFSDRKQPQEEETSGQPLPQEAGTPSQPLLIGGGAGVPPMFGLCRRLIEEGQRTGRQSRPVVILGFRSAADSFYQKCFEKLGARVIVATEDGSIGLKGFVTDALRSIGIAGDRSDNSRPDSNGLGRHIPDNVRTEAAGKISGVFACGPEAMLRAIDEMLPQDIPGQMSFEERMGCGFGACMGCSCETKYGSKRICKDGPVLKREEIKW